MKSIIKLKISQKILIEKGKIGSGYGELRQKKKVRNCEDLREVERRSFCVCIFEGSGDTAELGDVDAETPSNS